ncbi:putative chromo domain-containing protein, partial [Phytophthora infestans]
MSDYFGDNPTYDAPSCFRSFVEDTESNYFTQRPDATGLLGFLPEQKVTCALRMLAYGACADQLDELIRIGESTVLETMETFCSAVM